MISHLSILLFPALLFAQAPEPGPSIGAGVSGSITINSANCVIGSTCTTPGGTTPSTSATTYYIATSGNDSNPCTVGSKCITLAHVLALIPSIIDHPYIINVADGTYAEGIMFAGYIGGISNLISIVGNSGTPANVIFSGGVNCVGADGGTYTTSACITSSAYLSITGVKFSGTVSRGIFVYDGGHIITNNVQLVGATQYGFEVSLASTAEILGSLLIQNHATGGSGVGIHLNLGAKFIQYDASSITISSPATVLSWGIDINGTGTAYEIHSGTSTSLAVSGSTYGMLVIQGAFTEIIQSFGGTISFSNGSTPANSKGIYVEGGGSVFVNPGTVALTHFTTCLVQDTWGSIAIKATTYSSCGSETSVGNAGSVNVNF